MNEGKLLKTLRVTKNMLLLSEQLPIIILQKIIKKKITKKLRIITILLIILLNQKNSLPNITSNSHLNATSEDNNKDTV